MCLTLPETLISIVGIEKVIPRFAGPGSAAADAAALGDGRADEPLQLDLDGRGTRRRAERIFTLSCSTTGARCFARRDGRQTLQCIRCGACLNACPVYRQTGGHAYGSVYAGPIGAILTPQLEDMRYAQSLPYASSLCGACYEVCPVKINIPEVLVICARVWWTAGVASSLHSSIRSAPG